ncbi:MAG TPA: hypothetical protein VKY31_01030 [Terriglobia bacterium]|nr:hypothetical protein [Terriglobia bacterium]
MTLDEIVSHYIGHYRDHARAEMRFFEIQHSPSAAIHKAALCVLPSGKRHPHQRRIPRAVLELAEARLQAAAKRIAAASDFAALHDIVEREIGSIRGIGALTVYDIAHRLGAHLGKAPALVYLHAGTRTGAAAFGLKGNSTDPEELPAPFSRLAPAEIEDCLCIYKDELRGARRSYRSSCRT